MSDLKVCSYNKNHKIKASRLMIHESTCPDKDSSGLVNCPYNVAHKVKASNLGDHVKICPQKPKIDHDTHQEMLEYVLKNGTKNKSNKNNKIISNNTSNRKTIVGMKNLNEEKYKKIQQSEMRRLLNNSDIYDCFSEIDIQSDELDLEFEKKRLEDNMVQNFSLQSDFNEMECSNIYNIDFNASENNEKVNRNMNIRNKKYNPNKCEIFIESQTKNNLINDFIYYK